MFRKNLQFFLNTGVDAVCDSDLVATLTFREDKKFVNGSKESTCPN